MTKDKHNNPRIPDAIDLNSNHKTQHVAKMNESADHSSMGSDGGDDDEQSR